MGLEVIVGVVVGLATLGAFGATLGRWTWRLTRRLIHLLDDLQGEEPRPGVPARPGLMERMHAIEILATELAPNSGGSIKDWTRLKDVQLAEIQSDVRALADRVHTIEIHTHPH